MTKLQKLLAEPRMGGNSKAANENSLFGLLDLINFYNLKDKEVVEVGCYLGISTELFAMFSKKLTSVDIWGGNPNYTDANWVNPVWSKIEISARERLSPYANTTLIKKPSADYAESLNDESLDLIYIDAEHSYKSVTNDLLAWHKKVKVGGILSGHDYNQDSVKRAVDELFINNKFENFKYFDDTSWAMSKSHH